MTIPNVAFGSRAEAPWNQRMMPNHVPGSHVGFDSGHRAAPPLNQMPMQNHVHGGHVAFGSGHGPRASLPSPDHDPINTLNTIIVDSKERTWITKSTYDVQQDLAGALKEPVSFHTWKEKYDHLNTVIDLIVSQVRPRLGLENVVEVEFKDVGINLFEDFFWRDKLRGVVVRTLHRQHGLNVEQVSKTSDPRCVKVKVHCIAHDRLIPKSKVLQDICTSFPTDYALKLGDKRFPCHVNILKARSSFFQGRFSADYKDTKSEHVIELSGIGETDVSLFLAYLNEKPFSLTNMHVEQLRRLVQLASYYDVGSLKQVISIELFEKMVTKKISLHLFPDLIEFAKENDLEEVLLYGTKSLEEEYQKAIRSPSVESIGRLPLLLGPFSLSDENLELVNSYLDFVFVHLSAHPIPFLEKVVDLLLSSPEDLVALAKADYSRRVQSAFRQKLRNSYFSAVTDSYFSFESNKELNLYYFVIPFWKLLNLIFDFQKLQPYLQQKGRSDIYDAMQAYLFSEFEAMDRDNLKPKWEKVISVVADALQVFADAKGILPVNTLCICKRLHDGISNPEWQERFLSSVCN